MTGSPMGHTADYCIAIATSVTAKPSRLNHLEAASVPIGALTAWQGLFDRASLQPGEHILVHGGSGAVGVFAIQLARRIDAHVITTASPQSHRAVGSVATDRAQAASNA
jgi:NADPH:quinone reductase-like Zn-dependent oxidoreductase